MARELAYMPLSDPTAVRRRLVRMERLLEGMVRVPGTSQRLGLDVLLNLLPVGGTVIAAGMGSWLAWEARNLGMPRREIARMAGRIGFDMALGAVPWLGAIPDFFYRSNSRNLRRIKEWLDRHYPETNPEP